MALVVRNNANMVGLTNQSNLSFAYITRMNFICAICQGNGNTWVCLCNKCKRQMHLPCAGVKTQTVQDADGGKHNVLPSQENIPQSCPECLKLQVGMYTLVRCPGEASFCSITTGYMEAMQKPHKLIEGNSNCMLHTVTPGHELQQKNDGTMFQCTGCKMESFGVHYKCRNAYSCSLFALHEECRSPRKTTMHTFFPNLTFTFFAPAPNTSHRKHTNVFCDVCGMEVKGYSFRTLVGQNNLHPCCINLPKKTICGESDAVMVLQQKTISDCGLCGKRSLKVGKTKTDQIWSYVSVTGDYHLHVRCMITMLSDLRKKSVGQLISCKMTSEDGVGMMNLQLALRKGAFTCNKKFKMILKYAKIALAAIIAALMGDTTTLIVNSAMLLHSN